jgi:hypothetical protein
MTKRDLIEDLKNVPDDAQIVIAKCFVIDEKDEITAEMHVPVVGVAYSNKEDKGEAELRFVLRLDDVKQCFHPKDVRFLPPEVLTDRNINE